MANDLIIDNVRAMQPGKGVVAESLRIRNGKIVALGVSAVARSDAEQSIDGNGCLLTPGLIDLHTHGIQQFAYEADPQQIIDGAKVLGRYGTTCVLPTLYNVMNRNRLDKLAELSAAISQIEGVSVPGFHLEGPFLALPGAGAHTIPGDLALLEDIIAATGGRIAAMSISPDTPNIIPVIERLCSDGIVPFITHTQAGPEQTRAAIDAGARHATHFYDVFALPEETDSGVRPVGAVEAILADPRCTVDFICDGVHVHPTAIRAAVAAKGYQGVILITDSNVGAGLPEGVYQTPAGYPVKVSPDDAARIHDPAHPYNECLAGSALTMDRGINNLLKWLDIPAEQVWAMGTSNPARLLGLTDKGVIREGADADLVLWEQTDGRLQAVQTWVGGECVYQT